MFWESFARPAGRALVVGACLIATAPLAHAQLSAAWDVHASASQFGQRVLPKTTATSSQNGDDLRWLDQRSIATVLRYDMPYLQFGGDGILRDGDVATHASGAVHALVAPPAWKGFRFSATADVQHTPNDMGAPIDTTSLALWIKQPRASVFGSTTAGRLSYSRGMNAVWLAASDRRGSIISDSVSHRYLSAGYQRQIGDVVVGVSIGSQTLKTAASLTTTASDSTYHRRVPNDSGGFRDSTWNQKKVDSSFASGIARLSSVAAQFAWGRGRFALDATLNARPRVAGVNNALWGEANGVAAVSEHIAFIGGLRTTAPLPGYTITARRVLNFGLRIAPSTLLRSAESMPVATAVNAFDLHAASPGEYTVSMRLPKARMVELAGDFTGWKPVKLRQTDATHWEVTLPVEAGSHRCNVRIDGAEWVPPPGVTTIQDEFNGRVGIFVVE